MIKIKTYLFIALLILVNSHEALKMKSRSKGLTSLVKKKLSNNFMKYVTDSSSSTININNNDADATTNSETKTSDNSNIQISDSSNSTPVFNTKIFAAVNQELIDIKVNGNSVNCSSLIGELDNFMCIKEIQLYLNPGDVVAITGKSEAVNKGMLVQVEHEDDIYLSGDSFTCGQSTSLHGLNGGDNAFGVTFTEIDETANYVWCADNSEVCTCQITINDKSTDNTHNNPDNGTTDNTNDNTTDNTTNNTDISLPATAYVTVDNNLNYFKVNDVDIQKDGDESMTLWTAVKKFSFNAKSGDVIKIGGANAGSVAGVLASIYYTSNGVEKIQSTNESWICNGLGAIPSESKGTTTTWNALDNSENAGKIENTAYFIWSLNNNEGVECSITLP